MSPDLFAGLPVTDQGPAGHALFTFAAHVDDATVWSKNKRELVSLADQGTSLVAHLLPHEHSALAKVAGAERVIRELGHRVRLTEGPPKSPVRTPT